MTALTAGLVILAEIVLAPVALVLLAWWWLVEGPEPVDCIYPDHPHHGACVRPYQERNALEQYAHHVKVMEQGRRLQAIEERKSDA